MPELADIVAAAVNDILANHSDELTGPRGPQGPPGGEDPVSIAFAELAELRIGMARSGGGLALEVFVAARAAPGLLWLQLDSGNTGPAILAPHAAALLGVPDEPDAPVPIDLPDLGPTTLSVVVGEIIYDGNLGQAFLEGRALALDLARGRAWIGGG